MKQILIILLFTLFMVSCSETKNTELNNEENKEEMLSSPVWGGNTEPLENDSFRN